MRDWLLRQFEDPPRRERLFKIMRLVAQAMLALGVVMIIFVLSRG